MWINIYDLFYIYYPVNFIYRVLLFNGSSHFLNLNFRMKKITSYSMYFYIFYFIKLLFELFKQIILFRPISNFVLYMLKYNIYLLFMFLDLLFSFNIFSIFFYIFFFIIFYLHLFIYSLGKYVHIFRSMCYYILFNFCYNLMALFLNVFAVSFKFLLRYLIFNKFIMSILFFFTLYFFYFSDFIYVQIIFIQIIDFLLYIINLIIIILDLFYIFDLFSLSEFNYAYFSKLTFIHNYFKYSENYTIFIDFYYYLRILFIDYFPYKHYLLLSYLSYFKNFMYFLLYFNQIFILIWYILFNLLLYEIFPINILFIWFVFILELFYLFFKFLILFPLNVINIYCLWFFYFCVFERSFLYFMVFFNTSFIHLYLLDIYFLLFNINNIINFDYIIFNSLISYFFVLFDYFFHSTFQYPFNDYPEDLNIYLDNRITRRLRHRTRLIRLFKLDSGVYDVRFPRFWRAHSFHYNYRLKYGRSHFLTLNFTRRTAYTVPYHKFRHKSAGAPTWPYWQIWHVRLLIPKVYKRWHVGIWWNHRHNYGWNSRLIKFQKHTPWLHFNHGVRNIFLNNDMTPLTTSMAFSWFVFDIAPGSGFTDIDRFSYIYSLIFIALLFIFFSTLSKSFYNIYFPKLWYMNNSEYLWRVFREDTSRHGLWLYFDRKMDIPLGITEDELLTGDRFFYSLLAENSGLDRTDFMPFVEYDEFKSFYRNRNTGDDYKSMNFDYFCSISSVCDSIIGAMYLRESYHHFTDLTHEYKDFESLPKAFDFDSKHSLINKLNEYFFSIDKFFNFSLPPYLFHNQLYNNSYHTLADGKYFIPYDTPTLFENVNCWFFSFPLLMSYFLCFESIYSMETLVLIDMLQRLSFFFDSVYYFLYVDFINDDPNTIESAWTWIWGNFDDRFFFTKIPVSYDYNTMRYTADHDVTDIITSFLVNPSLFNGDFFSVSLIMCIWSLGIIYLFVVIHKRPPLYMLKFINKDTNYLIKFKLYFIEKLKRKFI